MIPHRKPLFNPRNESGPARESAGRGGAHERSADCVGCAQPTPFGALRHRIWSCLTAHRTAPIIRPREGEACLAPEARLLLFRSPCRYSRLCLPSESADPGFRRQCVGMP
jgi:hypothetical protein